MTATVRATERELLRSRPTLASEDAGLGSVTFLPHHRTGASAACTVPFDTSADSRAAILVTIPLTGGAGEKAVTTVRLRGPGDVLGIDPRQIVRRFPAPGTADAEADDLAYCEFDLPELPWLFTPTAPAGGRLPPWLRLVVVPGALRAELRRAAGLPPRIQVPLSELPPRDEAWAWAHVQVVGGKADAAKLAQRLDPGNPQLNLARLLCPRRLERGRWLALVVPTFEAGRLAGLGSTRQVTDLRWSWDPDAGDVVELPVYDHWEFAVAEDGTFEDLARRLVPTPAHENVGRRLVDTSAPGLRLTPQGPAGPRPVLGALVKPNAQGQQPSDGVWDQHTTDALQERVEATDRVTRGAVDPLLGPPLYAGSQLARGDLPPAGGEPGWLRQLNLDPAHRIPAALGAAVVRMDQEDLMVSAWSQLEGIRAANEALRAAQLGRYVGERVHARHVAPLANGHLLGVTQRAHSRVLAADQRTVHAALSASSLPTAATGAALRRLARPAGPVGRFRAPLDATDDLAGLLSDGERVTDWVRTYAEPDGVHHVGPDVREIVRSAPPELAELLDRLEGLGTASLVDELADGRALVWAPEQETGESMLRRAIHALLEALPTVAEAESLVDDAEQRGGEGLSALARDLQPLLLQTWSVLRTHDEWLLDRDTADRHRIPLDDAGSGPLLLVRTADVQDIVVWPLWQLLADRGLGEGEPWDDGTGDTLAELLAELVAVHSGELAALRQDLAALSQALVVHTDDLREPPRPDLDVASLELVDRLAPAVTVPLRAAQRLPDLATHFPGWLDDRRLDPVLAAPEFPHPMAEALHRLAPDWLLPGVGEMTPHELITLLATNDAFVEAFLVGLNHEFARELVWRGYPTDGRGTSFRSFWTRTPELVRPVHLLGGGDLGSHVALGGETAAAGRTDPALVFLVRGELVRRYPDLLAHVVPQQNADLPPSYDAGAPATTLFQLALPPDLLLVGVDLSETRVRQADSPWWFTLAEHPTEPRFGLTQSGAPEHLRDNLTWDRWPRTGLHLGASAVPQVTDPPDRGGIDSSSSALVAWLLLRKPVRAGWRAAALLDGIGS